MADTTFTSGTVIASSWLNDVNDVVYNQKQYQIQTYGALGAGADESFAAAAMIAATNTLIVPANFTLVLKNIELNNNTQVIVDGKLKLPASCSDFDRLLYASNKSGLQIKINEIDGNYAGQSGAIGTHLIYLTNCPDATVHVRYAHDHYISAAATMPAVDGIRNTSTGPIYLYESDRADVNVNLLSGWGREGIYLEQCDDATVVVGHCQGHATRNTEYSGVQVKGSRNKLLRASVDFAGASGVGFDTVDGVCENIISTNTRENHGVNFGHPGFPASRSVASNIVVDGAFVDGIKVSSATTDLTVQNFAIRNAGRYGFSLSDSSVRGKLTNGILANSGQSNLQVAVTEVQTANVRSSDLDSASIEVTLSSGAFVDGETVSVGGNSATIRKAIRNLSLTKQILFLTSVTGSFAVSDVVTGGTSGATGTVSVSSIPTQRLEQTGGIFAEDVRLFTGAQDQIRFPDGTAILTGTVSVVVATGGTLQTLATNYSSNVTWASTPRIVAQINSANSTSAYSVTQLRVSTTTTAFTINLNASVAQTYGVTVMVIGRWK